MSKVTDVVEAVRTLLHDRCKDMPPEQWLQVCEEIAADMDGNINAIEDENPELAT